ncbi:MAG: hypothetical protein JXN63_06650 [Candidatus Delongbacteria bacterium]|nr:hypothetical protein [Candidatus Delongbacteria bacterium]
MVRYKTAILKISIFITITVFYSCNIFSPEYEHFDNIGSMGDNSTIEGLMKNFVYAYTFKDSFLYEELLDDEFMFEYDEGGVWESWNKDEDVRITKTIFRNFKKIDLVFNSIFPEHTAEADTTILTSFKIDFYSGESSSAVLKLTGYSKFIYSKTTEEGEVRYSIKYWGDLK